MIGFAEVLTTLGVTDDDVFHAEFDKHFAEISPVNAPFSAQCTFSAPTLMFVPLVISTAVARSVYGVQMTTSHCASLTSGARSVIRAFVSAIVLFIFQLPAMIGFLIITSKE